jgi:hypothetical protein
MVGGACAAEGGAGHDRVGGEAAPALVLDQPRLRPMMLGEGWWGVGAARALVDVWAQKGRLAGVVGALQEVAPYW